MIVDWLAEMSISQWRWLIEIIGGVVLLLIAGVIGALGWGVFSALGWLASLLLS